MKRQVGAGIALSEQRLCHLLDDWEAGVELLAGTGTFFVPPPSEHFWSLFFQMTYSVIPL
jgi:hypothetical protein